MKIGYKENTSDGDVEAIEKAYVIAIKDFMRIEHLTGRVESPYFIIGSYIYLITIISMCSVNYSFSKSCLVFMFLLSIQSQLFSEHKFTDQDNIFTLTLPDEWREASKSSSDFLRKRYRSYFSPDQYDEIPMYIFHPSDAGIYKYPYIIICVAHPWHRCPDEALNDMNLLKKHLQLDIRDPNKFEVVKFDSNKYKYEVFDKHIFDPNKFIVWTGSRTKAKNSEWRKCIMALCLMDTGHIIIYCYSKDDELDLYYDDFLSIANSVEINEKYLYKPRLFVANSKASNSDWKNVLGKVLIGSIIGIFIAGAILVSLIRLALFLSKRKSI